MLTKAIIIQKGRVDFDAFLSCAHQLLGHNPAAAADTSTKLVSEVGKFLSCLEDIQQPGASHTQPIASLHAHTFYSVLIATDTGTMTEVLQMANMPFVLSDTVYRGINLAVVTGSLLQWREAVNSGEATTVSSDARYCFRHIRDQFELSGVSVWGARVEQINLSLPFPRRLK